MKNHLIATAVALTMSVSIIHQANAGCWREPYHGRMVCDTKEEEEQSQAILREYHENVSKREKEKYMKSEGDRYEREMGSKSTRSQRSGIATPRTNTQYRW